MYQIIVTLLLWCINSLHFLSCDVSEHRCTLWWTKFLHQQNTLTYLLFVIMRLWCIMFLVFISCNVSSNCSFLFNKHDRGSVIFKCLLSQCKNTEDKLEYNASQHLLTSFLLKEDTGKVLSANCLNVVKELKDNLASKDKFADYIQLPIKNCMDAMTTSPVES
jgi:hypothetical protein